MSNILLIEDNENNAKIMTRVLVRNEHKVFHATEGLVGLEIATKEQIDIVLVDLGLPDVGGATMVSLLKRLPNDLPIVVVTASFNQADWRQVVNRGIVGYMTKPINTRTFAYEVERFIPSTGEMPSSDSKTDKVKQGSTEPAMSILF